MNDLEKRALDWIANGQVGMSSKAIWSHMVGIRSEWKHPLDPDDFSRCHALLQAIPEWRTRLPEMADKSPQWAALVKHWDAIESLYLAEQKSRGRKCYDLMKEILDPLESRSGHVRFSFGKGGGAGTIHLKEGGGYD